MNNNSNNNNGATEAAAGTNNSNSSSSPITARMALQRVIAQRQREQLLRAATVNGTNVGIQYY